MIDRLDLGLAAKLRQPAPIGAEGVGLHAITPDGKKLLMNILDDLGALQRPCGLDPHVEDDEVVPRSGHLPEAAPHDQIFPVSVRQRSRQTIQIASKTIFRDILLCPSVRS